MVAALNTSFETQGVDQGILSIAEAVDMSQRVLNWWELWINQLFVGGKSRTNVGQKLESIKTKSKCLKINSFSLANTIFWLFYSIFQGIGHYSMRYFSTSRLVGSALRWHSWESGYVHPTRLLAWDPLASSHPALCFFTVILTKDSTSCNLVR